MTSAVSEGVERDAMSLQSLSFLKGHDYQERFLMTRKANIISMSKREDPGNCRAVNITSVPGKTMD